MDANDSTVSKEVKMVVVDEKAAASQFVNLKAKASSCFHFILTLIHISFVVGRNKVGFRITNWAPDGDMCDTKDLIASSLSPTYSPHTHSPRDTN